MATRNEAIASAMATAAASISSGVLNRPGEIRSAVS